METPEPKEDAPVQPIVIPGPVEVFSTKGWKEYFSESAMIVFSVLVALALTEVVNYFHEKKDTAETLQNIKEELVKNKRFEQEQYVYQTMVLKNIDSALTHPEFLHLVIHDGELHLKHIAPEGILYRDLSKVAWQVAQSKGITTRIDFSLVEKITNIYEQQARIDKLEDEIAAILLKPGAPADANARESLILVRDAYHGWAYDRAPGLIEDYDKTIKALE
ncbi:hypothetical protein [Mucilaginibacter pedocola]|uniref:Uncharacterized protein n=1 Tax=Mucilaginibacter pedocola TaxID=1792845 RepID=A0A1S9PDY4_9SPHI|nr:hypothetical protein [Mucilaginibacter pedocola]OOQ59174.1 hypothetical protein BC343_28855 [Mucilaginibacter pedocola]